MVTKKTDTPETTRRPRPTSVKGATADSPTPASSWKKATVGGTLVTVPSGNTALVRTPGMSAFITSGVIPNSLLGLIQEAMTKPGTEAEAGVISKMMDDPEKLKDLVKLVDAVCVDICLDPRVYQPPMETVIEDDAGIPVMKPVPIGDSRRNSELLYVDEVDFEDKMFLFNVAVGGTRDLDNFRS